MGEAVQAGQRRTLMYVGRKVPTSSREKPYVICIGAATMALESEGVCEGCDGTSGCVSRRTCVRSLIGGEIGFR